MSGDILHTMVILAVPVLIYVYVCCGKRWEEQEIDPSGWLEHFKFLFNTKANQCDIQFQDFVRTSMKTIEPTI